MLRSIFTSPFAAMVLLLTSMNYGATRLVPGKPTHYFYTPTAYVNDPYTLVIGLHEISFALDHGLQLQASLLDNIGRCNLAAKYAIEQNFSIGGGLAATLARIPDGSHGIPEYADPRLGLFLTYGFIQESATEAAVTFHSQIGDHQSMGLDLGLMVTPSSNWSFIAEGGSSWDLTDNWLYLFMDGGIRLHLDKVPWLFIDAGVEIFEFNVSEGQGLDVGPYIDITVAFVLN